MSTKKETTSHTDTTQTNQYNPASMNVYSQLQPGIATNLNRGMNQDLTNIWMQQANRAIGQIGNRMNSNLYANARVGGFQLNNPFLQASLARNSRAVGSMQGNAFLESILKNEDLKRIYTGMAMGYQPLQTGTKGTQDSQSVEKTSGLGTWLPQLAGAAIQGAMAFGTGGLSSLGSFAGGMFGGTPSPALSAPQAMPWNTGAPYGPFMAPPTGNAFFGQVP